MQGSLSYQPLAAVHLGFTLMFLETGVDVESVDVSSRVGIDVSLH